MAIKTILDQDKPLSGYDPETYDAKKATAEGYSADKVDLGGYDAKKGQVTDNQLVEKRLTGLMDKANPYMQQAATRGKQQANARGLLNTSMGIGAVENARLQYALPIAQQDAQAFQTQSLENQRYENQARQFNTGEKNKGLMYNAEAENRSREFGASERNQTSRFNAASENEARRYNADASNRSYEFGASILNEASMRDLEADIAERLKAVDFDYDQQLTSLKNEYMLEGERTRLAGSVYTAGMQELGTILANERMTTEQKDAAVSEIIGRMTTIADYMRTLDAGQSGGDYQVPPGYNSGAVIGGGVSRTPGQTGATGGNAPIAPGGAEAYIQETTQLRAKMDEALAGVERFITQPVYTGAGRTRRLSHYETVPNPEYERIAGEYEAQLARIAERYGYA